VQRTLYAVALLLVVALAACRRGKTDGGPLPDARPFASFATQRIVVAPVSRVRADSLGWVQGAGGPRAAARQLDSSLARVLDERGLAGQWVMPASLQRSYERNRAYASDPYQLTVEQLRPATFIAGSRFGEPLSTQLRTMIALETDVRHVMIPVELHFERDANQLRGVLRLVMLDPRTAEAKFAGEVKGDFSATLGPAIASVAARVADLFVAP